MIIKDFKYYPYILKFKTPFHTSSHSFTERKIIIIKMSDDRDYSGIGEIAPLEEFGSQTIEETIEEIKVIKKNIAGQKIKDDFRSIDININATTKLPAIKFALSQALLQILMQRGSDTNELLKNIEKKSIPINGLIGIKSIDKTIIEVEQLYQLGYVTIKLKIGRNNFEEDYKIIEQITARFGGKIKLRVDVNGKWSYDKAKNNLNKLQQFPLEYIEQPVKNTKELLKLAKQVNIPLAPDETVRTIYNAKLFIESNYLNYIVIKPSQLGSLFEILDIIKFAKRKNKIIIISSSLESDIGKSSLLLLAAIANHNCAHGLAVQDLFDDANPFNFYKPVGGKILFNKSDFVSLTNLITAFE